ncbi:MAG: RICIN domain-containing protein [Ruminococcus sp.]|uniref:GDSL-type esterase/lipase family protein n=1 Tax=Ruminococcus sp. TaxID=41978 RepID=UPI0025DBC245|nr:GDSL-type esterase/lipase family protein [Ruminococcus sp.]MCR5541709.1 RICIN domain-containing protein [Ruminococcus sp.]
MNLFHRKKVSRTSRVLSGVTSAMMALSAFSGLSANTALKASAATTNWKFDLGGNGAASGYTGVSAYDGYNSSRGYGFSGSVSNVSAGGSGAYSDAVKFTGGTFNVDLPKGLYQLTVITGNSPRTTIKVEGMLQMINLTGNNAKETIQVPVTDGQLNIEAVAGMNKADYTISAIEITQLNTTGEMKPTIWICGDSTVANYYNTSDDKQHGWGQYLNQYVNTNVFEVRNQASSGQYAKGFYQDGQFAPIKYYGKAGDYYIISIGINDTNYSNADEYYSVVTSMVKEAKSKGMNVILVKQQGRHGDMNRNPKLTGRWFGGQLDTIGKEQNVQVVDLFTAWQNFGFNSGGYDAMTPYYASGDDLHQSAQGAKKNAELVAGLMKIGDTAMDTDTYYAFKNMNSGLVMDVANGKMESGANIQQWGFNDQNNQKWKLTPFNNGTTYYYIRSAANPDYVLKAMTGSNGGNVELVPYAGNDSMMLFQFTKLGDGSYYISTRSSRDACFVETDSASTSAGANIQQWGMTYNKCQRWTAVKTTASVNTDPVNNDPPAQNNPYVGDVNMDGTIDVLDLVELKHIVNNPWNYNSAPTSVCDFNGDNNVNDTDVQIMREYLAGLRTKLTDNSQNEQYSEQTYYAIDQTWSEAIIETTNSGYTNANGYINLDNTDTSNITFTVNANQTGNYMTHIRFANGTSDDRPMKIYVNGDTSRYWLQSFTGTGDWTTWKEFGIVLPLVKGVNTIKMVSTVAYKGGPNLDYITLTKTDEPYAETYDPNSQQQYNNNNPTVFILGDSTVQSYRASYAPQQGWGYYLADYFNSNVNVDNRSMAGRSTKKAYDEGRWQSLADSLKAGDYVLIQFAINDAGKSNSDRYAPVCGNVNYPTEGSYEWYMTQFINGAKAKGATPILVTTVIGMNAYNSSTGRFTNSYTDYCNACKNLASKYSIPCIDLNTIMVNHYNSVGYNTALSYHLKGAVQGSTDGTHFCEKGANIVAGLVAQAIKNQKISGLYNYVK